MTDPLVPSVGRGVLHLFCKASGPGAGSGGPVCDSQAVIRAVKRAEADGVQVVTVAMLGHNVPRVFMLVFGVGTGLAALAGVIAGPALVTQSNMAAALGPILFVVVVVGGLGSLSGAFLASLLIGLVQTFAVSINLSVADVLRPIGVAPPNGGVLFDVWNVTVAQIAPIIPYLLLVLILIFRPTGLMGTREH